MNDAGVVRPAGLMKDEQRIAIIASAQFNAVGIALSLREIGWGGRIVCLKTETDNSAQAERWPRLCECMAVTVRDPAELPTWLAAAVPGEDVGAIFFCDERFLSAFGKGEGARLFPRAHVFAGPSDGLDDILDRRRFYSFVESRALAAVPRTIQETSTPWTDFGGPFRVRVWRSWRGMRKLPRGRSIHTEQEWREWKTLCEDEGLRDDEWGYQEMLSAQPAHVVSVCGWHEDGAPGYHVSRWVRQAGENGWLVELCPDPGLLREQTGRILTALHYRGPFEMEFMKGLAGDAYKVIELNPRFWMQHRLLGCEVVRRYVGWDPEPDSGRARPCYWLNTDVVLRRWLTLSDWGLFPLARRGIWAVPVRGTLGVVAAELAAAAIARMGRSIRSAGHMIFRRTTRTHGV